MSLLKKVTSAVAGLAIVFSIVSPIAGVSAAYTSLEAANKLATLGVIVDQSSNPVDYRLGDTITRREMLKVMANLSGVTVTDTCNGDFADLSSSDWGCKYAEAALANGMIAANATFRPDDNVSKSEGLKMVFTARGLERNANSDWRAGYVEAAVELGVAASAFTNYDVAADRGQIFVWAVNAIDADEASSEEDDLLGSLLGDLTGDDEDNMDDNMDNGDVAPTTPTTPVSGDLMVSLSPSTPAGATIPAGVNGLPVANFDFTAGSSDVTVSQLTIKRRGLSDSETLESLAVFSSDGRASNSKNDNQENDTEAQINLSNGGVVVKAGETKTLMIVVDIPSLADGNATIESDEFALELVDVVANATVEGVSNLVANTMRIGSVDAPLLTFTAGGTVSDPQLGEQGADIFEFEIEGSNDEDVILNSVTFEGNGDAEDNLMNFELYLGNDLVASTPMMNDDYLTFTFDGGLVIEEDKNEDFTVKADVVEGAGDEIEFSIDEELDVTASSTKFGYGAAVDIEAVNTPGELGSVTIEAGELTITEVNLDFDEIREDKDNVVLAMFKVTNIAGQNLELQEFGARFDIDAGTTGFTMGTQFFEDIELYNVDNGSSYELLANGSDDLDMVFSEDNIDVILPQGVTMWEVRVDTAEDILNFDSASVDVSFTTGEVNNVDGGFYVEETDDDTQVTDITPSTLSFNTVDGSESGAVFSLVPLSDTDVVRGADDVVMLQFEVEAEESSDITMDEFTVTVLDTGVAATNSQVSELKVYQGSVSDANLLDQESGSNLGTGGDVTFDDIGDVVIAANETETFIVTVSFVDASDAVTALNESYTMSIDSADLEDDDRDDVDAANLPLTSAREVSVNEAGTIVTLAYDDANSDNEFDKLALAGDMVVLGSVDVRADNEEVEVETVVFNITGATGDLANTVSSATLLLDGVAVNSTFTNSNSDITNTSITFEDIDGLVIPETTSELALQLNTANIGEDFVGEAQAAISIDSVVLSDANGVDSGKDLDDTADIAVYNNGGETEVVTSIVPAVVTPTVASTFGTDDQTAELRLVVDGGDNTSTNGDAVQAELVSLTFEVSSQTTAGSITVFNSNGTEVGTLATTAVGTNVVTISPVDSIGNEDETYRIETTAEAIVRVAKTGVAYTVNGTDTTGAVSTAAPYTTRLENTLELGQYANSN